MIIICMFHEESRVTFYGLITEHNTSIVKATYPPIFILHYDALMCVSSHSSRFIVGEDYILLKTMIF